MIPTLVLNAIALIAFSAIIWATVALVIDALSQVRYGIRNESPTDIAFGIGVIGLVIGAFVLAGMTR